MAIVDYKTAASEDDRLHRLQLQIYTAAGRREGLDVQAAYLMDLQKAEPRTVNVTDSSVTSAEEWATESVERMLAEDFPTRPGIHCEHCDVGRICGACAKTGARRG
jgi:DNA helicase-2/ATP-dependent DNA helicase PcrA